VWCDTWDNNTLYLLTYIIILDIFFLRRKVFLEQLISTLDNPSYSDIISWSQDGIYVVIHNWDIFCEKIIPLSFAAQGINEVPKKTESPSNEGVDDDTDRVQHINTKHKDANQSSIFTQRKRRATFLKQLNNYEFLNLSSNEANSGIFRRDGFR